MLNVVIDRKTWGRGGKGHGIAVHFWNPDAMGYTMCCLGFACLAGRSYKMKDDIYEKQPRDEVNLLNKNRWE